ncbi:MAG: CocE/NonD family hydrolase, partial [Chloroflexi bacterium]|nr:CocE/NonD family hydrolase [Chloroflexota bacterium]
VEWAARLPGVNGRVGTLGGSYDGFLQWRLAPLRPPSLHAMAAMSIPARYTDLEGPGTIRPGKRLHWWITKMSAESRRRSGRPGFTTSEEGERRWNQGDGERWLHFLPWLDLPREAFEEETEAVHRWLRSPGLDPWRLDEGCRDIAVPNLDMCGWYDHCAGEMRTTTTLMREGATEIARRGTRLIVGPWSHSGWFERSFGPIDFGPSAPVDGVAILTRWFDHWLKGIDTGLLEEPPVRIFVMGDDAWRSEAAWTPSDARDLVLFPSSGGRANTPAGDGRLNGMAATAAGTDAYVYDPADPVRDGFGPKRVPIPTDQRPLADRQDILVYQTEPLTERVEVTGNPVVHLRATSSAPDTDFFARLVDVAPDGLTREVSLGLVRARYRDGLDRPSLITPGEPVDYTIRLRATSNAFLPGHRIRLDITSSCFPSFDRNHNTAADQNADATLVPARQTVHHGGGAPTRLILPWLPNGTR